MARVLKATLKLEILRASSPRNRYVLPHGIDTMFSSLNNSSVLKSLGAHRAHIVLGRCFMGNHDTTQMDLTNPYFAEKVCFLVGWIIHKLKRKVVS